ncbi:CD209 antigen-like protein C isoform X1 [Silurus asotus]|uniref:CD209 antigen-like protein C isoform X1 n=1 Tax=Silurus asotus TaxID=30991 RepID=A0AAD5FUE4_SILAS|nr:CD209 antigen-like protein C isoform X1 [Silurus asotus]
MKTQQPATLNITLRLHSSPEPETELLNNSYYNLTIEELRTIYVKLFKENHQLHLDKNQLETMYTKVVKERNELETNYTRLVKKIDQFEKTFPELVKIIGLGWKYFNSKLYYISNEKKSWFQSSQDCKKNGAKLVTISSQEEEDFIIKLMGNKSQVWAWREVLAHKTGSVVQPNNETNQAFTEKTRLNSFPCDEKQWWVCEKTVFEGLGE